MRILALLFFLNCLPAFAQETEEMVDYSFFDQELKYLEEQAKKEEEKLLLNVDKISEEKVETPATDDAVTDVVSTKMAAEASPTEPLIPPPPKEKARRIRSR